MTVTVIHGPPAPPGNQAQNEPDGAPVTGPRRAPTRPVTDHPRR